MGFSSFLSLPFSFFVFFFSSRLTYIVRTSNGKFHYIDHIRIDHFIHFHMEMNQRNSFTHSSHGKRNCKTLIHSQSLCLKISIHQSPLFGRTIWFNSIIATKAQSHENNWWRWRRNQNITKSKRNDTYSPTHTFFSHTAPRCMGSMPLWVSPISTVCAVSIVSHRVSDNDALGMK